MYAHILYQMVSICRDTGVLGYPGIGMLPNTGNKTSANFANVDTAAVITFKPIDSAPLMLRDPVLKVDQEFAIDIEVMVRESRTIRTNDAVKGVRQTAKIRKPKPSQFLAGRGLRGIDVVWSRHFLVTFSWIIRSMLTSTLLTKAKCFMIGISSRASNIEYHPHIGTNTAHHLQEGSPRSRTRFQIGP